MCKVCEAKDGLTIGYESIGIGAIKDALNLSFFYDTHEQKMSAILADGAAMPVCSISAKMKYCFNCGREVK